MIRAALVARALALVPAAAIAGCYLVHERAVDAGPVDGGPIDAAHIDAPDEGPCAHRTCRCPTLPDPGTCDDVTVSLCCPIVGPLAPPDLPAA